MTGSIIHEPGKFEGEHISVPHFWDVVMDGCTDDVYIGETPYSFIVIDEDDRALFADLTEYGLVLWESDNGFVNTKWFETKEEFDSERAIMERESIEDCDEETEDSE